MECPLCRSRQVYYRSKSDTYACRRCGLGQDAGIKPEYLQEVADWATSEQENGEQVNTCPICGEVVINHLKSGSFACLKCGFNSGKPTNLYPVFLQTLQFPAATESPAPSQEPPVTNPTTININGRQLSLIQEAGVIYLIVDGPAPLFAPPRPYMIPVEDYMISEEGDLANDKPFTGDYLSNPKNIARAWKRILISAITGKDAFVTEFTEKFDGMTPDQMTALQHQGLLSDKARDRVMLAFREDIVPPDMVSIGYAAMIFELGLLDDLNEEYQFAMTYIENIPDTPVLPEKPLTPPVDQISVSFDGGKTVWIYTASSCITGAK